MYDLGKTIHTVSTADLRAINRTSVLELVRAMGPISRTEIARRLSMSLPTVMRVVEDLVNEKMLRPASIKQPINGRRRDLVESNGSEHLGVVIDLGGTKIFGAVADLTGAIRSELHFEHGQSTTEESFRVLCQSIETLVKEAQQTGLPITGITIGVPGITDTVTGRVTNAPGLDWYDFPLKARLNDLFPYPVLLENDVNLAALGEFWFGTEPGEENVVLMAVGTGIGAGIVLHGSILHGTHYLAGEVGYLIPEPGQMHQKYPGFGAFEQAASGTGIAARGRLALQGTRSEGELAHLTGEDVFNAARAGEPWAKQIAAETSEYLAQAISNIALIIDPDVILLGGGVSRSADLLLEPIRELVNNVVPAPPKIAISRLGYRGAVLGGVALMVRSTSRYVSVFRYE